MFSRELKLLLLSTALALAAGTVAAKDVLNANEFLQNGSYISSPNGKYKLIMQIDGSLVMYRIDGSIRFSMEKYGTIAIMQDDGNFVQYKNTTPLWATYSFNYAPEAYPNYLIITDSGNLRVENVAGAPGPAVKWQIGDDPTPPGSGVSSPQPGTISLTPPGPAPTSYPPIGINNATGSRY